MTDLALVAQALDAHGRGVLEAFLDKYQGATKRAYQSDLQTFFGQPEITLHEAKLVTPGDVNQYIARELQNVKPSTLTRRLSAVRSFYAWLMAYGVIERNPADKALIRSPKVPDSPLANVLSVEDAKLLIESAKCARDRAIVSLLLYTGLRRAEVAGIHVEHLVQQGGHRILEIPTAKGGTDQWVKVPESLWSALDTLVLDLGRGSGPMLVSSRTGLQISGRSVYNIVRGTAKRAGLGHVGVHDLRHTSCVLQLKAGATLKQVQDNARHKSIQTTMRYVKQMDRLEVAASDFVKLG